MQRIGTLLVMLTTLSWLLAIEASAQGGRTPGQAPSTPTSDATLLRSGTLFGYQVKSPQGEDLGKIEEIMIDMEAKRIAYAIVSFGGFLSLGDKWVPVPWEALTFRPDEKLLILQIEKEKLQKAPNFDKATLPELANRQWGAVIHAYYGYPPYWEVKP
jgi:sporulation protein YlmC with PRC-barrel domain